MASDINSCCFSGRLTRDAELKFTQGGQAVCKFGLACGEEYKDKKHTSYLDCVIFGKRAEVLQKHLTKGTALTVVTRCKIDSYEKDGQKKYRTEFIVNELAFGGGGNGGGGGGAQRQQSSGYDDSPEAFGDDEDSSIPF
jgi:single-strand DNA-binding protein